MGRFRIAIVGVVLAAVVAAVGAGRVLAEWPTTCVELNDIVEAHLGNDGNVGIYQRVFGGQAEGACQSDHIDDVRAVFAWAFAVSPMPDTGEGSAASNVGGWPTTCVDLNDIVENHLGNDTNVGIYQRTFGAEAETACRRDHADDVREVFGWATPCDAGAPIADTRVSAVTTVDPSRATLRDLAREDSALEMVLVTLPWLACHVYPWLADGVSGHDYQSLESLLTLSRINETFAMEMASYSWFSDGVDYGTHAYIEPGSIRDLITIAEQYPALLRKIREIPWMTESMTRPASYAILSLQRLAATDLELAIDVAQAPWLIDGVNNFEDVAIAALYDLAKKDRDLARQLASYTFHPDVTAADILAIGRIRDLHHYHPGQFHRLVNQPWYADGLNAEERAFIVILGSTAEPLFSHLLESRHSQSKTIDLPLAGKVTLWAFDWQPFPPGEDSLSMAAEAARELESFMGISFPIDSILISFVGYENSPLGFPAALLGDRMLLVRDFYPRLDRNTAEHRRVIHHEMAHYYFNQLGSFFPGFLASPRWLDEGGATAMEAYVDERLGFGSMRDRLTEVAMLAQEDCVNHGLENILKLTVPNPDDYQQWQACGYIFGEYMVLSLFLAMGESGLSAALREMYWKVNFNRPFPLRHSPAYPSDLQVYETFLKHTPPGQEQAVRDVYQRIHGGPYIPPNN